MASNPRIYTINNQLLNIKNVIAYLFCLKQYDIIPKFIINITDNELQITTIYPYEPLKYQYSGYTIITYNIYTKKWKGSINLTPNEYIANSNITYITINRDYPFIIDNNLLTINFQYPFIEYIIESDYIEDVLEPSLNKFVHPYLNPYNLYLPNNIQSDFRYYYNLDMRMFIDIKPFYNKYDEHEKRLAFLSKKNIISENYYLPEELWIEIYKYY